MKKINIFVSAYYYVLRLSVILLLFACESKNYVEPSSSQAYNNAVITNNPFSVSNIQSSLENLYNQGRISQLIDIYATHTYLRFKPSSIDDLRTLDSLGFELSEVPYDDASTISYTQPKEEFPWLYTVVPFEYSLPETIKSEFIENLYLFNEDSGDERDDPWQPQPFKKINSAADAEESKVNIITKATDNLVRAGVQPLMLYNEAMRVSGHNDEMILNTEEARPLARYYPTGIITVFDTDFNQNVPVKGVYVKARRFFKMDDAETDGNGRFYINTGFRNNATIIVKFQNSYATTRGINSWCAAWQYFFPIKENIGTYRESAIENINYNFNYNSNAESNEAMNFVAATYFNSLWDSRAYSSNLGIPAPPRQLNVWLSSAITTQASTPMLRYIADRSLISQAIDIFLLGASNPALLAIKRVLQLQLPDITCRFGSSNTSTRRSANLSNTFFHELGHSQHCAQVGNVYWTKVIRYIVRNGGYGNTTSDTNWLRIQLSEGWGFYVGGTYNRTKYANIMSVADRERDQLENQDYSTHSPDDWIYDGFFHDMTDVGEPSFTGTDDAVDQYTPASIFNALQPDVAESATYVSRVLSQNNNKQFNEMWRLFWSYE